MSAPGNPPWVLDTPALLSWQRGTIVAAAAFAAARDVGYRLLVPAACLVEWHVAHHPAPSDVRALLGYPHVEVVPLDTHGALIAAQLGIEHPTSADDSGSGLVAALHAASLALELDAPLVTDAVSGAAAFLPEKHPLYYWPGP